MKMDIDRRQALTALAGAGTALAALTLPSGEARAGAIVSPPTQDDERFMRMALAEAAKGDFPFGAVIAREGQALSTGRNLGKLLNDPTAHGEMVAIHRFLAVRPASELQGATLYTTGEPCPMCMGAILWCGISRLVFAASIDELAKRIGQIMISSRAVADAAGFANIEITGGVLSSEAMALFSR